MRLLTRNSECHLIEIWEVWQGGLNQGQHLQDTEPVPRWGSAPPQQRLWRWGWNGHSFSKLLSFYLYEAPCVHFPFKWFLSSKEACNSHIKRRYSLLLCKPTTLAQFQQTPASCAGSVLLQTRSVSFGKTLSQIVTELQNQHNWNVFRAVNTWIKRMTRITYQKHPSCNFSHTFWLQFRESKLQRDGIMRRLGVGRKLA